MKKTNAILFVAFLVTVCFPYSLYSQNKIVKKEADVCVYGASAAGVFSAIAVAREGYSVIVIEPTNKIGGLLGSGFRMQQDAPSGAHLGGLTGYYYKKDVALPPMRHYQAAEEFNITTLESMISKYDSLITIIKNHRLSTVNKKSGSINSAFFEYAPPGRYGVPLPEKISDTFIQVKAKMFIDASYEGDLMAYAGVSYRVGKESKKDYGESLAGIVVGKKFPGVDPYIEEGNPKSGILSCINPEPLGKEGDSSNTFMGYNFKLAWERVPTPKHPGVLMGPPEHKNKDVYELLRRYEKAGYKISWPEENFLRNELMTGAIPGSQLGYPDGNWEKRSEIWSFFVDYIKMLNDYKNGQFRFIKGINEDTDHWPFLYIRGGRRMIGEYVMTQQDVQLQTDIETPIGLGYYNVDIYPNRLVVLNDGVIAQEGDVFETVSPGPYQIPFGAIIPQKKDCENLLVPLCISASHVAYSSIRMEATYMVMGESAGIAAAMALEENKAVQDIDRSKLVKKLDGHGQILEWDGLGYDFGGWRSNIFGTPRENKARTRWLTHPEEYRIHPVDALRKKSFNSMNVE